MRDTEQAQAADVHDSSIFCGGTLQEDNLDLIFHIDLDNHLLKKINGPILAYSFEQNSQFT